MIQLYGNKCVIIEMKLVKVLVTRLKKQNLTNKLYTIHKKDKKGYFRTKEVAISCLEKKLFIK